MSTSSAATDAAVDPKSYGTGVRFVIKANLT